MKMRSANVLGAVLLLAGSAVAQPTWTAVFSDSVGDPGSVTISPGDSFTFRFDLVMTDGASGNALDYYLGVNGNDGAGSGKFTLTQRNRTGSAFNAETVSDASVIGVLNPTTARTLGVSTDPFEDLTGTQFIANLTFATAADLAPGEYSISIDSNRPLAFWSVTDENWENHPIYTSYGVTVLPEPASVAGLAMLAIGALRRVRRGSN